MTQYDENLRYKGMLDLSASEVDELFHALMHHQSRIEKRIGELHPYALVDVRTELTSQYRDTQHLLITLRRELKREAK